MADPVVPMSGTIQVITAIGTIITGIGAIATPVLILLIKGQHKIKQDEIALEVERVRLAAIEAANKVELVRLAAEQTAERVEEVRQETQRTTHRVEDVKDVLDANAKIDAAKLDELGRISTESLKVSGEALRVGNGILLRSLQHTAELARWKADSTPAERPESKQYRREAELAEKAVQEHLAAKVS